LIHDLIHHNLRVIHACTPQGQSEVLKLLGEVLNAIQLLVGSGIGPDCLGGSGSARAGSGRLGWAALLITVSTVA
jgi:hypothetical protein